MSEKKHNDHGRTHSGPKQHAKMPVLFIGHGAPLYALGNNRYADAWRELGEQLPRPKAILCISAHWQTQGTRITAMPKPRTIHDFGNFGEPLNSMQYPAPGYPELAQNICARVKGIELDHEWGLDHGSWCVLHCMYPKADIPVLQLSLNHHFSARQHYQFARQLGFLRDENILILGSGNIVHSLPELQPPENHGADWAVRFDAQARRLIEQGDHDALINYPSLGSDARRSIPTDEHYLPLLYVLGLQQAGEQPSFPVEGMSYGSTSMRSVWLSSPALRD